jgi:hypothetical protein
MDKFIYIIAGPLFLISTAAHIYVRIRLRPGPDLDEYYYEFEDANPEYARYTKWSNITFAAVVIAALLLFAAAVI